MQTINYLAVVVAAIVNMGVGFFWFGPLFGKQWTQMMGWTPEQMEAGKVKMQKEGWKTYLMQFGGSLLMAWVLAYAVMFTGSYFYMQGISIGLITAFWAWVGFVVPSSLASVLWEGRAWKLWGLNATYYLFALLIMGTILSLWA